MPLFERSPRISTLVVDARWSTLRWGLGPATGRPKLENSFPAAQAQRCIEIINAALEAVGKVRGEFFRDIRPVDTIMQVMRFVDPEWLVEFEADAFVTDVC